MIEFMSIKSRKEKDITVKKLHIVIFGILNVTISSPCEVNFGCCHTQQEEGILVVACHYLLSDEFLFSFYIVNGCIFGGSRHPFFFSRLIVSFL